MKIAVCSENDMVFQHFGHTPEFTIFEVEDDQKRILGMTKVPTGECGHGALAGFLAERDVKVLICGGIGGGAQEALAEAGIKVIGGTEGEVIQTVGDYLLGKLETNQNFTCTHHHGEHSCGSGK